jgi:hypothetical protein
MASLVDGYVSLVMALQDALLDNQQRTREEIHALRFAMLQDPASGSLVRVLNHRLSPTDWHCNVLGCVDSSFDPTGSVLDCILSLCIAAYRTIGFVHYTPNDKFKYHTTWFNYFH